MINLLYHNLEIFNLNSSSVRICYNIPDKISCFVYLSIYKIYDKSSISQFRNI